MLLSIIALQAKVKFVILTDQRTDIRIFSREYFQGVVLEVSTYCCTRLHFGQGKWGGDHLISSGINTLEDTLNRLSPVSQIRRFPLDIPEHLTYNKHTGDTGTLRRWQEMARVLLEAAFLQEIRAQPSDRGTGLCQINVPDKCLCQTVPDKCLDVVAGRA